MYKGRANIINNIIINNINKSAFNGTIITNISLNNTKYTHIK